MKKNGPLFNCQTIYACFGITSLELNMAPGVLIEPYMSQGSQGVVETPIVLKGLKVQYIRVAMAQGKQGIWLTIFPDRENTGNLGTTQEKFGQHREFSQFP